MTTLRNIGNSQGILIPKALIHQANLEGHHLEFELVAEGLLIKPIKAARVGWKLQIAKALEAHPHDLDHEWLDADLLTMDSDND